MIEPRTPLVISTSCQGSRASFSLLCCSILTVLQKPCSLYVTLAHLIDTVMSHELSVVFVHKIYSCRVGVIKYYRAQELLFYIYYTKESIGLFAPANRVETIKTRSDWLLPFLSARQREHHDDVSYSDVARNFAATDVKACYHCVRTQYASFTVRAFFQPSFFLWQHVGHLPDTALSVLPQCKLICGSPGSSPMSHDRAMIGRVSLQFEHFPAHFYRFHSTPERWPA